MKFKNGDHVSISIKAPVVYKKLYNMEGIIKSTNSQFSLKVKLINPIPHSYTVIWIQAEYLKRIVTKNRQLHFNFS